MILLVITALENLMFAMVGWSLYAPSDIIPLSTAALGVLISL